MKPHRTLSTKAQQAIVDTLQCVYHPVRKLDRGWQATILGIILVTLVHFSGVT